MQYEERYAAHPDDAKGYDTDRLRREFLIEKLFEPDDIRLIYSAYDRLIVGGIMPVGRPLELTPIDPLKVPQEPAEPIAKENRATFEFVRDRIAAELNGEVKDEERITQLDSLVIPQAPAASAPAGETTAAK